jgi:hypothetical protein
MKTSFRMVFLIGVAALVLASCARGPKPIPVTGTVRLGGRPLADGDIQFHGIDGSTPATAAVTHGRFALEMLPGDKRVEIRAYRGMPNPPRSEDPTLAPVDPRVNYIPARYNADSTLKAEVTAQGPNTFEYTLELK